ncbi:MAG: RidA family protein [Actinobacteria bacterium]|jgi:enamine deaminase RidA (YjgF/YER057c/UK114 family)|nr:RidA family protein [Actinomycetota bacterium]
MNRILQPTTMPKPAAAYAHGIEVSSAESWVFTSGVVPTRADGSVPSDLGEQAAVVWANISAILAEAQLSVRDIVSITTYVVESAEERAQGSELSSRLAVVMAARDAVLQGHLAASTLVTVPALARPEWRMEISVVAAR